MINEVKAEVKKISGKLLSWMGRIHIIKMVLLPKILYKFQMIPIALPMIFFQIIKIFVSKYIWQHKKPRLQCSVLSKYKAQGGLALPDFRRYYNAVVLSQILDWAELESGKRWVKVEKILSSSQLGKKYGFHRNIGN